VAASTYHSQKLDAPSMDRYNGAAEFLKAARVCFAANTSCEPPKVVRSPEELL
jgi:hypothetical protein